jgi:hypothetical protein
VPGPPKIARRGEAWVATAGVLGDRAAFEPWVTDGRPPDGAPELDDGFEALVAEAGVRRALGRRRGVPRRRPPGRGPRVRGAGDPA